MGAGCVPVGLRGETGPGAAGMPSVAQIVAKNAAARGGAEAWHRIDSMVWIGHVESSNAPARFVLAMRRPNKTRFEVVAMNRMALRVYDGTQGWKLRPMQRGEGPNVQPYTPDELKFAHDEQVIDGLLIDHAAKGIEIALEGTDDIEGRKAYRLNVRMPSGATRRVWIDAGTFLEVKYERETRGMAGSRSRWRSTTATTRPSTTSHCRWSLKATPGRSRPPTSS